MSLYNFHRVLIGAAILFDIFFTFWAYGRYRDSGDQVQLVMAVASSIVTAGLVVYLVYFNRNLHVMRHIVAQQQVEPPAETTG